MNTQRLCERFAFDSVVPPCEKHPLYVGHFTLVIRLPGSQFYIHLSSKLMDTGKSKTGF